MTTETMMRPPSPIPPGETSSRSLLPAWIALAAALAAGALLLATQLAGSGGARLAGPAVPSFLAEALGSAKPSAPLVRRPARGVIVQIKRGGYTVQRNGRRLHLETAAPGGDWKGFAGGATRTTQFGGETVTVGNDRTEQFLTVEQRQGPRTWRWRLDAGTLEPKLSVGGRVELLDGKANSSLSIAPAAVLDAKGRTITPAGTRWRLERRGGEWSLALRLDDRKLPLPYVIDPAADYPSPLNLRSTASSVAGSWLMGSGTGAANTATSTTPGRNVTGWFQFNPGVGNTSAGTPSATATGRGWLVEPAVGGTGFPAGTWSFTVVTDISGGTLVSGTATLGVGIWKGTIGGTVTALQAVTEDAAAQDLRTQLAPKTTTVNVTLPKFALATNETLYIELWRRQVGGINSTNSANRQLTLAVNSGSSFVAHPAADDTAPTPALSITAPSGAYLTGTTLYYRGSVAGSFAFRNAMTDAGSGPFQSTYPAIGTTGWTHGAENVTTGPNFQSSTYSWTASPSVPAVQDIVSEDNALQTATTGVTFVDDSTAPATNGSLALTGLVGTGGLYSTSTNIVLTFANGTDAGSGIAAAGHLLRRAEATLSSSDGKANGTCGAFGSFATIATTPASPYTDTAAGGVQTGKCYRYEYVVTDNVGNTRTYTSGDVKVDTAAPGAPTLTLAEVTGSAFQHVNGSELFYNPSGSNAGSFRVDSTDATTNDAQSGVANVDFPALPAGFTGGGSDTTPTPYRGSYSWDNSAATSPGVRTVTVTNNATGNATQTFTVTKDVSAPTGQAVALVGGPWYSSASVSLTPTDGSDNVGGSGLDTASRVYEREEATLAGGACGSFGGSWTVVSNPDATVQSGKCYRYRLTISDNVGNTSAPSGVSVTAMVDLSAPSAPSLSFGSFTNASATGTTVYIRTGVAGGFTVSGTSADAQSAIASLTFPALGAGWSGGGSDPGTPFEGIYSYTPAASAPSGNQDVTAANGAGTTSAATPFTVVADTTAPTSSILCDGGACAPWFTTSPVSVTLSASDGGSGLQEIRYTTDGSDPTPLSTLYGGPISIAATTTVKYRAYDNVGNIEATATQLVRIDTTAPSVPGLTLTESDAESHVAGTTLYYNPSGSNAGSFTVTGTSSDAESAIAKLAFPALTGMTGGGDDAASPYEGTYDWTAASTAAGAQTVTAYNGADLTRSAGFTVTPDTTAPTGHSVAVSGGAGWLTSGSVSLIPADGSDGGAGLDTGSRVYERESAPLAAGSCGAWSGTWTTVANPDATIASGNCYRYRLRISDNVANQSAPSAATGAVMVDLSAPSAPSLSFGSFTNASATGATVYIRTGVAGGFTVSGTSADAQSAIASLTFPALGAGWSGGGSDPGTPFEGIYSYTPAASAPSGNQDVTAANGAGTTSAATPFTVVADTTAPTSSILCDGGACAPWFTTSPVSVTLSASDGGSGLQEIRYTTDGSDPTPLSTLYGGPISIAATTTVKYRAYDNVGNIEATATQLVRIDTTAPSVPSLSFGSFSNASVTGSTVYVRPGVSGGFTVTGTSSDGQSGVASLTFPGLGADWTGGGADAASPFEGVYTYTAAASAPSGNQDVTAANGAGSSSGASAFTVVADATAPTTTATCDGGPCGPWFTTSPVSVVLSSSDGGAGVDEIRYTLDGSDPDMGSPLYSTPLSIAATTTVKFRAYDEVGNVEGVQTQLVQVDTSAPDVPSLSFGSLTNAAVTGSTVYVRTGVAGGFTVTGTSNDTESGVASHAFPTLGAGWTGGGTDASSPFEGAYSFDASASAPGAGQDVTARNGAGLDSAAESFDVVADTTAPSSSVLCEGGLCAPWFTTSPVPVTLSATDAGSDVDTIRYTLDGSDPDTFSAVYAAPLSIAATTTVKYRAYDRVGNEESVQSATVKVDTTQPSVPALTLNESDPDSHVAGTTLYYNPGGSNSGSFSVDATSSDAESAIDRIGFPTVGGLTGGGDDLSGPYSGAYDWTSATSASGPETVTAHNGASLTRTSTFTLTPDTAAPSGHSVSVSGGAGWVTSGPVTLVPNDGTDGGAGLDTGSRVYERDEAPLTDGACGAWAGSWTTVATPDNTVQSGYCYRYRFSIADNVGNRSSWELTGTVMLDTSAPAAPALGFGSFTNASATGSTVYIRPGVAGAVTVTGAVSDLESGVASVAFPSLGAGWTGGGADAGAPYDGVYTFSAASAAPSGNQDVVATNGAGTASVASPFTVVEDSTAPVTSADCDGGSCAPWFTTSPVSVTLGGADGGSGIAEIRYTLDGSDPDGTSTLYAGPISVATTTTVKYRAYDRVGNVEAVRTRVVQVDTTAPSAPTLSFGSLTNASATGSTVYIRTGVAGGFTVGGPSVDAESGIDSVAFPSFGAEWTGGGADAGAPYESAYTFSAAATAPSGGQDVVATNGAGTSSPASSFTVVGDGAAPVTSAQCDGGSCAPWFTTSPVAVALSANDGGSGLDEIRYTLDGSVPSPLSALYSTPLSIAATTTVKFRAYDNVGNEEPVASVLVKVDTTIPSAPVLSFGSLTNASATGSTVYVRTGVAGGFIVSGTSDDPESSVASLTFPALGAGWTGGGADASAPFEGVYGFGAGTTPPSGNQDVTAANGSGRDSDPTPFTVVADATAPVSSALCDGGSCAPWFTTSPVAVALSASDGGSGLDEIRYTLDGSDPSPLSALYSTPLSIAATTTVKFRAYDNVGNEEPVASVLVQVDTTQPSVPALTVTETDADSHSAGTTLYYNPSGANAGSFTVDATASDAESGIDRLSFPAVAGMAGGGDDTSSPYSATYDWTSSTGASGAQTVTARNGAALTRTADFTVEADTAAPTGHSVSLAGGDWATTASVGLVPDDGTDTGAGVDTASRVYERDEATLSAGACGPPGGTWTTVSNPDTTVESGTCYRYRLRISDRVGNQSAASAPSATVRVDTSAPTAPSLAFGTFTAADESSGTVYYRPTASNGAFTVTASSSDPESAVAGYAFPAAATGWSVSGSGASRTYSHTGSPSDPADPGDVTATNGAGVVSAAGSYTITPDATAPTGMSATATGGYASGLSVPITLDNGTDTGSGVDAASRVVERDEAPLDNGDGSCDPFPGSWSTVTLTGGNDTTVVSGTCYRYRLRISDRVGNEDVSGLSSTVKVDATDPTGSVTAPAGGENVRGASVTVSSDSADSGAGVASARFQHSPANAGTWTDIDTDAGSAPWSVAWDTTGLTDGLYDLRAITTDGSGRTATSALVEDVRIDNSDPSSTSAFPSDSTEYNATSWDAGCATAGLCGTASDAGSGVDYVELSIRRGSGNYWDGSGFVSASEDFVTAAGTGSWSYGFAAPSFPADGTYTVRVRAVDAAGNVESTTSSTFTVDNVAPVTAIDSQPADPTSATAASFEFTANEPGSAFECKLDAGLWLACGSPHAYGPLADGSYTFSVRATDVAGNTDASPASFTWLVDTTAPSTPTLTFDSFTNAAATAGEVFYRPSAASGEFAVTADSTDAQSGVSGYSFPALADWSRSVAGDTATYSHSGTPSDPAEPNDVTATSGSGVVSAPASFTVTPDASAPTGMSASVSGGYVTSTSVPVTLDNGTDTGSGVDAASRVVERDEAPLDNGDGTCDAFPGSWSTVTLTGGDDTTVVSGTCYRYRLRISDRVGNEDVSAAGATVKVDTSAPAAPSLGFSAFTNASASGSTLWFRPGVAGGFTLAVTATDAQSGIASNSHPNLGTGWSRTGNDYSFTAAAIDPVEPNNVTVTNGAGLTSVASAFTVSADSAAPAGGSVTYADGYDADGIIAITLDNGTDGDSGVNAASAVLERQLADLADGTCSGWGAWTTVTSPDTVPTGKCARYRLRVSDRVGNEATYTSADVVKVDTTAPAAPALTLAESSPWSHVSGTTVYVNTQGANAGTFTVSATSSDAESGLAKIAFPALAAMTGGGDDASSPYESTYDWTAASTATGAQTVVPHNAAGLTSSSQFTVAHDTSAPTGGSVVYTGGFDADGTVTLTLDNGTDAGAGVDASSAVLERETAGLTDNNCGSYGPWTAVSWPDTVASGLCARYRLRVSDNVGNEVTYTSATVVKVDTEGSTVTLDDPGANVRGTVALSASASDAASGVDTVEFERSPAGAGTWTAIGSDSSSPYSASLDTVPLADGLYDLRARVTDNAGNAIISAVVGDRRVDNTAPTATVDDPGANLRGTVTLSSSATDAGSGVASRAYEFRTSGGGAWTPTPAAWDTTALAEDLYDVRVVVTDNAGNATTSAAITDRRVDNTAPTVTMDDPGADLAGTVALSATSNDGGSGLSGVIFQYKPAADSTWTATPAAWDTTPLGDGLYDVRAIATDNAGNSTTSAPVTERRVDNHAPEVSISAPGQYVNAAAADPFAVTATSPDTDLAQIEFFGCDTTSAGCATGNWVSLGVDASAPFSRDWPVDADGNRALRAVARDLAGNYGSAVTDTLVDRSAPAGGSVTYATGYDADGTVTVTLDNGTDAGSGIDAGSAVLERQTAALAADACGAWSSWSAVTSPDTVASGDCARYRLRVSDEAGNEATYTAADVVKVDTTPPVAPTLAFSALAASVDRGSTLYYRPGGGSFTLTAAAADPESGVTGYTFPALGAGWSDSGTGASRDYAFAGTPSEPGAGQTVTAANAAGLTAGTAFAVTADSTPPAGASVDYVDGYRTTTSVALVLAEGSDAGSGLDSATTELRRATASLADGVCDTFGAMTGIATAPAAAYTDVTVASGNCYRYELAVHDALGNQAVVFTAAVAKVDAEAPTGSLNDPGANLRGTVELTAVAADTGGAGVSSVEFRRAPAGVGPWTTIGTDTTAPYSASFDTTAVADGLYDLQVLVTDGAGTTTASAPLSGRRVDNTLPAVSIDDPGAHLRATVALSAVSSDAGSGLASTLFERAPAGSGSWTPVAASWDTTLVADGFYDLRAVATDNAGNQAVSAVLGREVDNTPPQTTIDSGPATLDNDRTPTFALSSNESPDVTYECSVDGGAYAPCGSPATLGSLADGAHTLDVRAADLAGNVDATPAQHAWTVDATDPTVSLTFPAPGALVSGIVTLTASASDASGAPDLEFELSPADLGDWTTVSSSWDTTAVGDGRYDVRVVATDPAGNTSTATAEDVLVDNTAPLVAIDSPAGPYVNATAADPFGLAATATDAGSGVASLEFLQRLDTAEPCASPSTSWSSIGLDLGNPFTADWTLPADGEYVLCALASDAAGHERVATATVTVDRTDPAALIDAVAPFVRGTIALASPSTDATSGVGQVDFQHAPSGGSSWQLVGSDADTPFGASFDTTTVADGDYDLRAFVTDRAGNAAASAPATTRVDNTPPTGSVTAPAPATNLRLTVPVTSDSADAGSGVESAQFQTSPTGADTWTNLGAADTDASYGVDWDTTTYADGLYDLRVVTTDRAGNTFTSPALSSVRVDNTKPTGSIADPGAYLRGSISLAGTAADEGSGVATVEFQRSPAGAGTWTSISTDADEPYGAGLDTAALADGLYDLRVLVTDNAGNQETVQVANRRVDNTKPTASLADPGAALNAGVTLTASASDDGSGVASVEFQRAPAGSGSWTTLNNDSSDPYTAPFDTTAVGDGLYDLRAVVTDNAGNQESSTVGNKRVDNTAPSTSASGVPGGPTPGPVTITLAASDGGVGVAETKYRIDGGALQTYSGGITLGGPDGAYTIQYFSIDALGNVESTHSVEVVIDNTAPGAGPGDPGRYLRGVVSLTAEPEDASGIASVEFQFSPAGAAAWATIDTVLGAGPYELMWNTVAVTDGPYDLQVLVTDGAGNVTTAALPDLPKIVDNTSPTGAVTSPAAGALRSGTFTITATASDEPTDGSVAAVEFQVRPSGGSWTTVATDTAPPYSTSWNSAGSPDGAAELRVVVSDVAGNDPFTSDSRSITLDNNAPSVSLSAPGAGSGTVALSASGSSDIETVVFERRTGGGAWTSIGSDTTPGDGFGVSFDTGGLADGTHELRARAIDVSGNEGTSSPQSISVDNTAPTAAITQPAAGANVGASVALGANASDGTSGVASVVYQFRPAGGTDWTDAASASGAPWSATWNASGVADGQYEVRARVTDAAGNTGVSAPISVTVDATAPTVVLGPVAGELSGTVTLTATTAGDGVASVTFERRPSGGSWAAIGSDSSSPYSLAFNTASIGDGVYDIRAVVRDGVGNSNESVRTGVRIDNSAPSLVRCVPEDGATITVVEKVELTASEPLGSVEATVDGKAVTVTIDGANATIAGTLSEGAHVVNGQLRDLGGRGGPFRVSFTVVGEDEDGEEGPVERNLPPGAGGTVISVDGGLTVIVPAGAIGPGEGWSIFKVDTGAPRGDVGGGFAANGPVWDITARTPSGKTFHSFAKPLELIFSGEASHGGVVPGTFENGSWRPLPRLARPGTLPEDQSDGFWRDGDSFHVLTRHLTLWAILADSQPPQAPQDLRGTVGADGLTLHWRAGADNSGLVDEVTLFVNGERYAGFDGAATETKIGAFTADDGRVFTWRERDAAGNQSALTPGLRALPELAGKSLAEAQRALAARGFKIGAVSEKPSTAEPGTVIEPAGVALALEGSSVKLVVAAGARAQTKFVFGAVGTKRLDRTKRAYIGVRLTSSRAATVRATLIGPTGKRLYTWRLRARAGASIVRLRLPRTVRKPGAYRVVLAASAGGQTVRRTIAVRFLTPKQVRTAPRGTSDVVLAGPAATRAGVANGLKGRGTRPFRTNLDGSYKLTGAYRRNVQVVVVDVDRLGLGLVRGLRTVFPTVRIVALSNNRGVLARAKKAGANLAFARSTPDPKVVRTVRRLASGR